MSNTQYAVCHLQRGSGNDSGMSCHIERKDAKGKVYVPANADANRTQLNRELIAFPAGVKNRTDAIQFRIDHAGLHRKVGKNQTKAIRIILTGTHEQMMKIANDGKLDNWINANMKWLKNTFGSENLVSCVLHMDEKTPHLHATIVPIVTTERLRKKREGDKKYETKSGARLSADDVMRRAHLEPGSIPEYRSKILFDFFSVLYFAGCRNQDISPFFQYGNGFFIQCVGSIYTSLCQFHLCRIYPEIPVIDGIAAFNTHF